MTVHPPINDAEFNTVIEQRDWARGFAAQVEAENARLIDAAADVEVLRRELAAANADNEALNVGGRRLFLEAVAAGQVFERQLTELREAIAETALSGTFRGWEWLVEYDCRRSDSVLAPDGQS